jgi:pyruvate/2-oxoglutarate dehydrogenase complex dihydrolipoamide dehydrogenase (E3) component
MGYGRRVTTAADVIVLGMGPGGEYAAGKLAEADLDVIGIDHRLVGGECPYWGCVPSKMMIRAADALAEARRIDDLAGTVGSIEPNWTKVATRIRKDATDDWDDKVAVERFEKKGGRFVRGTGRITGPKSVEVQGTEYTAARALIVATGTEPVIPPVDGLAGLDFWTNREAIETETVPSSLVVLGGGAIGCELAQVFARFGSDVHIVEGERHLVSMEEVEACELLQKVFVDEGITVLTGAKATKVSKDGDAFVVAVQSGDDVRGDRLLIATGRKADLMALGVDAAGLDANARFIDVDDHLRAGDGVWALGDVTGKGLFTHIAMYQAAIVVKDILGEAVEPADYAALPRVTFTDPEIASVGLTEANAREQGIDIAVAVTDLGTSARGWIHKAEGFIKLVADRSSGVLIGATSAGPSGGEVLSMLTLAIHARVPVKTLQTMIYAYPTFHRAIEDALRELEKALAGEQVTS